MEPDIGEAHAFLRRAGAPDRLLQHAVVVEQVAQHLVETLRGLGVAIDGRAVRIGAVLHDCGKIVHPEELGQPGHVHETAGRDLLLQAGYPAEIAEVCVRHAAWDAGDCSLEHLVVALADKLWKGKREAGLEGLAIERVAGELGRERWEVFDALDTCFETIASRGDERLLRSQGPP